MLVDQHQESFAKVLDHLHEDLQTLRTGRATPAVVESLLVPVYGTATPLQQLASITSPEPTQLLIQPYDPNIAKDIAKAIQSSPLGITPSIEGISIRLAFPPLTEERRKEMQKVVKEKAEKAKVSIRSIREGVQKDLKQAKADNELSEDMQKAEEKALQEVVDSFVGKISEMASRKDAELMQI
ncbi:MAG: ribosome recycling factor [Patescibacteria group bacterium]|jgi:ribosome recycling factor